MTWRQGERVCSPRLVLMGKLGIPVRHMTALGFMQADREKRGPPNSRVRRKRLLSRCFLETESGDGAEFLPASGGILHSLIVREMVCDVRLRVTRAWKQ